MKSNPLLYTNNNVHQSISPISLIYFVFHFAIGLIMLFHPKKFRSAAHKLSGRLIQGPILSGSWCFSTGLTGTGLWAGLTPCLPLTHRQSCRESQSTRSMHAERITEAFMQALENVGRDSGVASGGDGGDVSLPRLICVPPPQD